MDTQWFLTRDGETIAQFSTEEFKRAVAKGRIYPTDFVRRSDSSTYVSAAHFVPADVKRRSAAPAIIGGIVAVLAVLVGLGQLAKTIGPSLETALSSLEHLKTDANVGTVVRRTAIRQALLSDSANNRFYQALAEKDPEAFETMVAHFADATTENVEEIIPKARDYLMKQVLEPRAKYLPDDDRVEMMALSRDMSLELAQTNPKLCIAVALGKPFGDIRPFVTDGIRGREENMMLKMLDASPHDVELRPAADLQALNTQVATKLYDTHKDDIGLLDLANVPDGKQETACRVFADYIDGVLNLPREDSLALLRAMTLDPARLEQSAPEQPSETTAPGATVPDVQEEAAAPDGETPARAEVPAASPPETTAVEPDSADVAFPEGARGSTQ